MWERDASAPRQHNIFHAFDYVTPRADSPTLLRRQAHATAAREPPPITCDRCCLPMSGRRGTAVGYGPGIPLGYRCRECLDKGYYNPHKPAKSANADDDESSFDVSEMMRMLNEADSACQEKV